MKLFKCIAFLGIVLILGAVDAADAESITYWEMVRQILLGAGVAVLGTFFAKCTAPKRRRQRRLHLVPTDQLKQAG